MPIFDIQEAHLRNFTTTERDVKRGIDKFPPEDYRNPIEDLLPEVIEQVVEEESKESPGGLKLAEPDMNVDEVMATHL